MTPDDAARQAARIGITDFTPEKLARLAALAANTDAQVARLPLLAKDVAPANVFVVPQP
ncbi:MAG: hypothetical protein HY060_15390 [Proteobacteria bacterium]|nr:hypothetical protein [Pseudomonadota bacterium]